MSDLFKNPSSEIPDEMWRAPAPMQRQADAVVLWAELTGKHASGCGSHGPAKPKKKKKGTTKEAAGYRPEVEKAIRMVGQNPEAAGALMGAPLGAAHAYFGNRAQGGGISRAEASLIGDIAAAKAQKADKKKIESLKARLAVAKERKENLGRTTLIGGALGAAAGGAAGHLARRKRK